MNKLLKILNKFNGNICFAGSTDHGDIVFECDRETQTLVYAYSTKLITDVGLMSSTEYAVAFGDEFIGRFTGGILTENFIDTGITYVQKLIMDSLGNYYLLNRTENRLYKYNAGSIWTFILPDYDLRGDGNIFLRESDGTIIYSNDENIHLVRDDTTSATLINSLPVGEDITQESSISVVIGGEFNPSYSYVRARMVSGSDLEQSSSSNSSSSSSSSSSV